MHSIITISKPSSPIVQTLLFNGFDEVLCVSEDMVVVISSNGKKENIKLPENYDQISVDIPIVRKKLMEAYPLYDRWISNDRAHTEIIERNMIYTVGLIIIAKKRNVQAAILETGAPHHVFTYCLHAALSYLSIPTYYLYVNATDGRLMITIGTDKISTEKITDYDATHSVHEYVNAILKDQNYVPNDSSNSLHPRKHRSILYALFLQLKVTVNEYLKKYKNKSDFQVSFKKIKFLQAVKIFRRQALYKAIINNTQNTADISDIGENDIVYVGHMVPEATSFPDSFEYPSEIDVLIDLKIRFPNSKIFYREHPAIHIYGEYGHIHYQGLHKNLKFFQLLRTLNIHLINSKMHISNVRKKNCLFATKTGRVAIENSVLGRSTIVYGFPFYGFNLPGTVHISNLRGDESVSDIKQFSTMKNAKYQICKYLIGRFSGSIANPGIGAPGNDHLGNYNYDLQLLSKYLFEQHYR